MSLLKLSGIGKIYYSEGSVAVGIRGIDLSFERGEFVAVTGASGSGKSTLLNVISGMDSYEEGELYIEGAPTSHYLEADWEEYRSKYISFIFQDYNILESYTVLQNVELALMHIRDRRERRRRAVELLTRVGMEKHLRQKGSKLSGGQKQRTVIARALAKDSPIILADEPTGNLDEATSKEIIELLREVSKDKLLIIVTHNYEEVEGVATRHIRIYDGAVEFDRGEKSASEPEEKKDFKYIPAKKKKFNFKEFLRDLRDGINLGGHVFASRPKLAIFTCLLMTVGMLGIFFITSTGFDRDILAEFDYGMFEYTEGRVVAVRRDGATPTLEEIEALAEKYSAEEYYSCDYLLDKKLALSRYYTSGRYITHYYGRNDGVTVRDTSEVDFAYEGELPDEEGEILLCLPVYEQENYGDVVLGETEVYVSGISFKVTGISFFYDNNKPTRVFITEEEFNSLSRLMSVINSTSFPGIMINGYDKNGGPVAFSTYDNAVSRELGDKIYVPKSMGFEMEGGITLSLLNIKNSDIDLGEDCLASDIPEYLSKYDGFYNCVFGIDAITKLADSYVDSSYGQFSLVFKSDAAARRAANEMLESGYIAVLSDAKYEPEVFEKFAMGFLVFLMGAIWLAGVVALAFFIRLCQSRSIVSFKNDIAIMRSMGIKAIVIKISMYMRSVIAVIPATAVLGVFAALIYTSPEFNRHFNFMYGWQYALICLGLLLVALRVSYKQQGKLFEGSVKKTLTGGELND